MRSPNFRTNEIGHHFFKRDSQPGKPAATEWMDKILSAYNRSGYYGFRFSLAGLAVAPVSFKKDKSGFCPNTYGFEHPRSIGCKKRECCTYKGPRRLEYPRSDKKSWRRFCPICHFGFTASWTTHRASLTALARPLQEAEGCELTCLFGNDTHRPINWISLSSFLD